ncbi:MAG: alkaline phytoceramidase, partial [Ignavibacteria bacterium]|nr:alkaline phytoceramidase [Ignavibacteria bacterium]
MKVNRRTGLLLIGSLSLVVILILSFLPRIPQDQAYFNFADQRNFFGIPNFFDVVSNIPIVLVGGLGLWYLLLLFFPSGSKATGDRWVHLPYLGFFLGTFFTGFGSAFYHLEPDNESVFWDRLPMAIAFTSFLTAMITERISLKAGLFWFLPLLISGAGSVIYWRLTEQMGMGDLRPYILVQYYSPLVIVLLLLLFLPTFTRSGDILAVLGFYGLAKVSEILDKEIFVLGGILSGHT